MGSHFTKEQMKNHDFVSNWQAEMPLVGGLVQREHFPPLLADLRTALEREDLDTACAELENWLVNKCGYDQYKGYWTVGPVSLVLFNQKLVSSHSIYFISGDYALVSQRYGHPTAFSLRSLSNVACTGYEYKIISTR